MTLRVDELERMVYNLTAQTHHFNAKYETDTRSALRDIEQLQTQLASEAARQQAPVARVDELVAENSHYKSVNEAMKMEAQEYLVKVKLDVASAALEHKRSRG
jgi:CTP synthase (UTP-ammonia lyase)